MLITTGPISPPLQGLKTGMYYLRTRSAAAPIQFTVDQKLVQQVKEEKQKREAEAVLVNGKGEEGHKEVLVNGEMVNGGMVIGGMVNGEGEEEEGKVDTESQAYKEALLACSRENREACIMCSS